MKIELRHGSGGEETGRLIHGIFEKYFSNPILDRMEDGAVLPVMEGHPVFTSDSFVVEPLFFPGGDIGRLSICGTVNDLASMGARPLYLTASFILETGLDTEILEKVVSSMAATAKEAGVSIVAGDTKVIEGKGGLYINTAGIGERRKDLSISASAMEAGDAVLLTGTMGDHHATILTERLHMKTDLQSDCAPLNGLVQRLLSAGLTIHTIRDITRGGLATVAGELAASSGKAMDLWEEKIPVSSEVKGLAGILGLDPLTMGNEGKMIIVLPEKEADRALSLLHEDSHGKNAAMAGTIREGTGVTLITSFGGRRRLLPLRGEGLPRIC
jgi:hydrogenase expression/formation protein HypE